jgi:hypothetical protein
MKRQSQISKTEVQAESPPLARASEPFYQKSMEK